MARRILVIDGHPDTDRARYVHALADAYAEGARAAGHEVRRIEVAQLDFAPLRSSQDFTGGRPPAAIARCQESMAWAEHWVILFPLWLGAMPGVLKSFLEQALRPGFAFAEGRGRGLPRKLRALGSRAE